MSEIHVILHVNFYDDPENPTSKTHHGMIAAKSVRFAFPPRAGDRLFPYILGPDNTDQPIVQHVQHGPKFNDETGPAEAIVTVTARFNQKVVDHLEQTEGWMPHLDHRY
ncbi:hypothetical protein RF644_17895 [Kocuria sp. CPCC 205258]|uniref:hypothetical protein n=1 Tax=Kocuria sp. CPCC 205258 TaxID=3073552 RepID=UPI0034D5F4C2